MKFTADAVSTELISDKDIALTFTQEKQEIWFLALSGHFIFRKEVERFEIIDNEND